MSGAGHVHCDDSSDTTNTKGAQSTKLLTGGDIALSQLPQTGITAESDGRVCSLPCCGRYKALEETTQALFVGDQPATV